MYGRSSAFCLALGFLALSCASDDELTPATPDVPTQEADPGTPDSPGIALAGIEASSASDHGTTDVVVTFDADLPDTTVRLVDHVTYGPSASVIYTAQTSNGLSEQILVCGDTHAFPSPGNRTVDILIPADWFDPGSENVEDPILGPVGVAKIIICEPEDDIVQISIWGAASARSEDVMVTVEGNAIRVALTPDPVQPDLRRVTVVRVDLPPYPGATGPVGRCYEFSGAAAESTRVACLFGFEPDLWEWNSEIYVLKRGQPISRASQEPIAPDPETGLAIAKFDDSIATAEEFLLRCVDSALVEAVSDITGPDAPPMYVSRCIGDYALVGVNHVDYLERERVLVMESAPTGDWEFIAEIDFANRDRIERCASLPDDLLRSLGDLCTTFG